MSTPIKKSEELGPLIHPKGGQEGCEPFYTVTKKTIVRYGAGGIETEWNLLEKPRETSRGWVARALAKTGDKPQKVGELTLDRGLMKAWLLSWCTR